MKLPTQSTHQTGILNTFTLAGNILLAGHVFAGLSPWFIPLTVLAMLVGYGSEIRERDRINKINL
jgi:hypothetical protein